MTKPFSILAAISIAFCALTSCEDDTVPSVDEPEEETSGNVGFGGSCGNNGQTTPDSKVKVGIFGDSISTFKDCMCNADYGHWYPCANPADAGKAVDKVEETWWYRLINEYMVDAELDVNSSWEGTKVISHTRKGIRTGSYIAAGFIDRCKDFVDPDYIFIHGGTNDKNQSTPLGTFDYDKAISALDEYSFRPAYIKVIKTLQSRYKGVKIVIIIGDMLNGTEYGNSIKAIADHFSIPCVDFRPDYPLEKDAGSHPNSPAFQKMAEKIARTCKDVIPTIYSE